MSQGVGDDYASWAYDGNRLKRWNGETGFYGLCWKSGDIVGCFVDMDNETMEFSLNGINLGVAYTKFKIPGTFLCSLFTYNTRLEIISSIELRARL